MKFLNRVWEGWKRIAVVIGNFQAMIILTLLYIVLVVPVGCVIILISDPLRLRRRPTSTYWVSRESELETLADANKQF